MKLYVPPPPCPDCGWVMEEVNNGGIAYFCPKAIGAAEWDENWKRHYFPPENPHREVRRWTPEELAQIRKAA